MTVGVRGGERGGAESARKGWGGVEGELKGWVRGCFNKRMC